MMFGFLTVSDVLTGLKPKEEKVKKEQQTKIKVEFGNWYLNAGIVGFLNIVCKGDLNNLDSFRDKLIVGEDFIEFDKVLLNDFESKFYKQIFLNYFDKSQYLAYINKALKEGEKNGEFDAQRAKKEIDKFPFKGLYEALRDFSNSFSLYSPLILDNFSHYNLDSKESFEKYKSAIESIKKERIYNMVINHDFIHDFMMVAVKGIISLKNFRTYMTSIINPKDEASTSKKDKLCVFCQARKGEFEVNNSVSNIIGLNYDNSNWIWGFDTNKTKICPVCALFCLCASVGLSFTKSKKRTKYLNSFYFINDNETIKSLIKSNKQLRNQIDNKKDGVSNYALVVREVVNLIVSSNKANKKSCPFFEIIENDMGGQNTKNYNIYSFTISPEIAEFLSENFKKIPFGYYYIDKEHFNLEEELLRLTIKQKLGYKDLDNFLRIYINKKRTKKFDITKLVDYILSYINYQKGNENIELEKISKEGFINGRKINKFLKSSNKEIQKNSLIHQFLNDLRIADKSRFLNKYLQLASLSNLNSSFNLDELDKDAFLHFGYSFISGLLNIHINTKEKQGEENE